MASDGTDLYTRDPSGGLIGVIGSGATPGTGMVALTDQHDDVVGQFTEQDRR